MNSLKMWWKEAVVYQIYPRSFYDSNADGIGDLEGITQKLEYLQNLGIDVIWLSPHYKSPNADNGYDIADYEAIMEEFGSMADFDNLLAGIHQKGMKLVIDLVVNHTSDEHNWFQQSRKSKDNHYRHYYIWKKEIPNNWISFFSGDAWQLDPSTNEYYLHYFAKKQPDLNWENETLRKEIYKMMRFWLSKGVNGFRMDVISLISKDQAYPDFPKNRFGDLSFYANGPKVHDFISEMNAEVLSHYDCMTVGEAFGVDANQALNYIGNNRNELQMIYHFEHAVPRDEHCFVSPKPEFTLLQLKEIFNKWDSATAIDGWNTVYFGNHDNPRMLSRFGNTGQYKNESAKMLATILLTLRGTPYIYQGDEIGMSNAIFASIEDYNDIQVKNAYQTLVVNGGLSAQIFLENANKIARDHARTPMQWNNKMNAGFSIAKKPWLKINESYQKINIEQQETDPNSILNYYKSLIKLRKTKPVLIYGAYQDLAPNHPNIWVFTRESNTEKLIVINNFTENYQSISLEFNGKILESLLSNYTSIESTINWQQFELQPYESIIYQFQ